MRLQSAKVFVLHLIPCSLNNAGSTSSSSIHQAYSKHTSSIHSAGSSSDTPTLRSHKHSADRRTHFMTDGTQLYIRVVKHVVRRLLSATGCLYRLSRSPLPMIYVRFRQLLPSWSSTSRFVTHRMKMMRYLCAAVLMPVLPSVPYGLQSYNSKTQITMNVSSGKKNALPIFSERPHNILPLSDILF